MSIKLRALTIVFAALMSSQGSIHADSDDDLRIELDETVFTNIAFVSPRLEGAPGRTVYLPKTQTQLSLFFAQVQRDDGWYPDYEYTCSQLYESGVRRITPDLRRVIGMDWSEVRSTITPTGFKVAPGTYRVSLVYTLDDPSIVPTDELQCELIQSPVFRLTAGGGRAR